MMGSEGGLDDLCRRGAPGSTLTTTPPTPGHEANQCCSSVQWVPSEVLEEEYGHSFGI